jgi:hypothetical protein
MKEKIVLFIIFLTLSFCICSDAEESTTGKENENDDVLGENSAFIGSEGGIIESDSGSWILEIPKGALTKKTEIKVSPGYHPIGTVPAEYKTIGYPFKFEPEGLKLNSPAIFTVKYDQIDMVENGIEERLLNFYYINDDSSVDKTTAEIDFGNNSAKIELPHFSFGWWLTFKISFINSGGQMGEGELTNIADAIIDELNSLSTTAEINQFVEDNSQLLIPFLQYLYEQTGMDIVSETFPDADFDGDGIINSLDPDLDPGGSSSPMYTIGGTISGLVGTGLILQNNNSSFMVVDSGTSFTFPEAVPDSSVYDVTVLEQPSSPEQLCTVLLGSGTVTGAEITDIEVNCTNVLQVETPFFDPDTEKVGFGQVVTISSGTPGADIYYTTDGVTEPTCTGTGTSGTEVTIESVMTVKAIACKLGYIDSLVASGSYTYYTYMALDSSGNIYKWEDGANWTFSVNVPGLTTPIAYDGTTFRSRYKYSTDGITWYDQTDFCGGIYVCSYLASGNNTFISFGYANMTLANIVYYLHESMWNSTYFWTNGFAYSPFFAGGIFFGVSSSSIVYSYDGISWGQSGYTLDSGIKSIGYGCSKWIAVGLAGKIYYATDVYNSTDSNQSVTAADLFGLDGHESRCVAIGSNGTLIHSDDGISWTFAASSGTVTANTLNWLVFDGVSWVAVGDGGVIIISNDGDNWFEMIDSGVVTTNSLKQILKL